MGPKSSLTLQRAMGDFLKKNRNRKSTITEGHPGHSRSCVGGASLTKWAWHSCRMSRTRGKAGPREVWARGDNLSWQTGLHLRRKKIQRNSI